MLFSEVIRQYDWAEMGAEIAAKTAADVEVALGQAALGRMTIEDFKALVSPAAATPACLERMAALSRQATQKRFGKTIQFYIPLYLSNECTNHCIYCGFNHENKFQRVTLNDAQIMEEAEVLKKMGYEHLLLLTGESPRKVGVDYIEHAMRLLSPHFAQLSLEVFPMDTDEYARLCKS
ncbi:MAG: 2-iminoacetate synthase ThiH, partial [Bacteroidales bacterium]|nr:2-iminoacetate synthase ThiH [Bacteroidales bacterium]